MPVRPMPASTFTMGLSTLCTGMCAALVIAAGGPASGQAIRAALIKPWGGGSTPPAGEFWADIANNWAAYGGTEVVIDASTFIFGQVTAAALAQANPDVLIFADCAGGTHSFNSAEQAAITGFLLSGGKRAVSTFLAFQFNLFDNRWLLPLFGLDPNLTLTAAIHQGQSIAILDPQHPLAFGLPPSFTTGGHTYAQVPADWSWDPPDYAGMLVAYSPNGRNIVHYYAATSHDAVVISFMPEFGGNAYDRQLVYNSISETGPASVAMTMLAVPSIGTVLPIAIASPLHPNAPYIAAFSGSAAGGIPLSDGRSIPLAMDALFWFSLDPNNGVFLNTAGMLDSTGTALSWVLVDIPPWPSLVGATVAGVAVTLDAGSASGFGGISAPLLITVAP